MADLQTSLLKINHLLGLDKLEPREKNILLAGGAVLFCILLANFIVEPYLDARKKLTGSITAQEKALIDIRLLQQTYKSLKNEEGGIREKLKQRPQGFTLFNFLDRQTETAKIKANVKYMKPSTVDNDGEFTESIVEMKIEDIGLAALTKYLELIESEINVVSIRRLSIQRNDKAKGKLDVILQVVTFDVPLKT